MAETQPDHEGAWYCASLPQFDAAGLRNFCPPEGCPKGYCARNAGWKPGEASPDRCTGNRPLAAEYHKWMDTVIDEEGMKMPYGLIKTAAGEITIMAMDLAPVQTYRMMLAQVRLTQAQEAIFSLDRFALPDQGLKYEDLLAGHYFDGSEWHPFIIEYRPAPRVIDPIDWSNDWWNAALRGELDKVVASEVL